MGLFAVSPPHPLSIYPVVEETSYRRREQRHCRQLYWHHCQVGKKNAGNLLHDGGKFVKFT